MAHRYRLLPRMLVDAGRLDAGFTFLGHRFAFPCLIAPMAMHGLAHPQRELATVRAAAAAGIPMVRPGAVALGMHP